jgi:hypothetical protein
LNPSSLTPESLSKPIPIGKFQIQSPRRGRTDAAEGKSREGSLCRIRFSIVILNRGHRSDASTLVQFRRACSGFGTLSDSMSTMNRRHGMPSPRSDFLFCHSEASAARPKNPESFRLLWSSGTGVSPVRCGRRPAGRASFGSRIAYFLSFRGKRSAAEETRSFCICGILFSEPTRRVTN